VDNLVGGVQGAYATLSILGNQLGGFRCQKTSPPSRLFMTIHRKLLKKSHVDLGKLIICENTSMPIPESFLGAQGATSLI